MPFVESSGRKIYYERQGEGPPVLFCHGAGSNAATWWQQLPAFTQRHTCITMDIRCFGRSAAPLEEFLLPVFVEDVLAVIDAEALGQIAFIGQSLGGMIGLQFALKHPQRIEAFVACDTSLTIDHPVLVDIVEKRLASTRAVSIEQRSLGQWFLENHPDRAALYTQINHFNPSAHSIPSEEWEAALGSLLKPANLTPASALRRLECPALFLVGREDPIVPVSVMHEFAALVHGSKVAVIERAGHSAYFEKPEEFNEQVLDFIGRTARFV